MLVLVVGPSGAGKDTLLQAASNMLATDGRFHFARRTITRAADAGGEAHEAVDAATFERRRAAGGFALWWRAHDLHYGIPTDITDEVASGRVVIASVSRTVIAEAARRFPVQVIEITAPASVLAARLAARGRETATDIAARLAREIALPDGVAVETVMNDGTLDEAIGRFVAVLRRIAESCSVR